jgi:NADH/F420H2 dehydrogenase subunit C
MGIIQRNKNELQFCRYLQDLFPRNIENFFLDFRDKLPTVHVQLRNTFDLPFILLFLRDHCLFKFKQLIDVFGVDYPAKDKRFSVYYNLTSLKLNFRVLFYTTASEFDFVYSISSVFKGANWLEREVWDMYGVFFANHPDLRRILTDYGFSGYPLRKDFPLSGFTEVFYDDEQKSVVSVDLEISQEFRLQEGLSPWDVEVKDW